MEFRADAAIDHVNQGSTIVHLYVILVIEALDLGARNTLCHRLVPHIHLLVHPWDKHGCVEDGKRVHFRAQVDELDDRISLGLVLEETNFSSV